MNKIYLLMNVIFFLCFQAKTQPLNSIDQDREKILYQMEAVMGPLPERKGLPAPLIIITDSCIEKEYTIFSIQFDAAPGEVVYAYLYIPIIGQVTKHPAMLALHETDPLGKGSVNGEGSNKNLAYARELAKLGYVVIAPDYPNFGNSKNYDFSNDRFKSGTMKGIFNHMRCVDVLEARNDVDPNRIGVIGHSLGGHNAMFVAAFDTRLKVVISSCGWTEWEYDNLAEKDTYEKLYGGQIGNWATELYMPLLKSKFELDLNRIPFNFHDVINAIAPRAFFSNSPAKDSEFNVEGVKAGIQLCKKRYKSLKAAQKLKVKYPDSTHDFPSSVRFEAYKFLNRMLNCN